jgi:pantothenate kinase-related protein Tda10
MKKMSLAHVKEAQERLVKVEQDLKQLEEKWGGFQKLAMAARVKKEASEEGRGEAVDDFWHWINLSNNKKALMDIISGKTDNPEQQRIDR